MLLRELELKPRETQHYFDVAWVALADGTGLYLQRSTDKQPAYGDGLWWVYRTDQPYRHSIIRNCMHDRMDEFEAQAVLDHYLQTIGPSHHDTP